MLSPLFLVDWCPPSSSLDSALVCASPACCLLSNLPSRSTSDRWKCCKIVFCLPAGSDWGLNMDMMQSQDIFSNLRIIIRQRLEQRSRRWIQVYMHASLALSTPIMRQTMNYVTGQALQCGGPKYISHIQ